MSIFFCDSNCELWYEKIDELGVQFISMPYVIDDEEIYYDLGRNTDFKNFYDKVRKGAVVKTTALNEYDYIRYFEPFLQKGEDIIYVHFSSEMSGTFQSMNKAINALKEQYPDRCIKTVDTLSISMGAGLIVYEAAKLWAQGTNIDEIIKWVEDNRFNYAEYFIVEDLKYLKAGGRISPTVAFIGKCLNMKPILNLSQEGKIDKVATARGTKQGMNMLVDYMKQIGENVADHPIVIIHADNEPFANYLKQEVVNVVGEGADIWVQPVGPVIGSHAGPGTIGLIFHSKHR